MNFQYLEMWAHWQRRLWAARQWLSVGNPDAIAARCMFQLNHYARHRAGQKSYFYALKNQLVQHFYQSGFCESVTQQVQTLPCWSCNGTGVDEWNDGDECWKCHGTGIYRRHHLYRFVFRINGISYVWHQPDSLVTWPVELTSNEQGEYHENDAPGMVKDSITTELIELYYATAYLHLQRLGYPKPVPSAAVGFRDSLCSDWYHLFWGREWRYKLRRQWRDAIWWLHQIRNATRPGTLRAQLPRDVPPGFIEEQDIPF